MLNKKFIDAIFISIASVGHQDQGIAWRDIQKGTRKCATLHKYRVSHSGFTTFKGLEMSEKQYVHNKLGQYPF